MSDLSDILTENPVAAGSPIKNTMVNGLTERVTTSSSFSERVENTLRNVFPFTVGTVTGDEVDTQKEEENNEKIDDLGSHVSLNSSTHENEAPTIMENGYSDRSDPITRLLMEKKTFKKVQDNDQLGTAIRNDQNQRVRDHTSGIRGRL